MQMTNGPVTCIFIGIWFLGLQVVACCVLPAINVVTNGNRNDDRHWSISNASLSTSTGVSAVIYAPLARLLTDVHCIAFAERTRTATHRYWTVSCTSIVSRVETIRVYLVRRAGGADVASRVRNYITLSLISCRRTWKLSSNKVADNLGFEY